MQKDGSSEKSADKSTNELIKHVRLTFGHHNLALAVLHLSILYPHFLSFCLVHDRHVDIEYNKVIKCQIDVHGAFCPSWSYYATLYILEKKVMPNCTLFH